MVEATPAKLPRPFAIEPDLTLQRRYAPRGREPLNRVTIPF